MKIPGIYYLIAIGFLMLSCSKEEDDVTVLPTTDLLLVVDHDVDGDSLFFFNLNEERYKNAAGNYYEVTRLEYYLAEFKFIRANGKSVTAKSDPYLVNAENGMAMIVLKGVELGDYTGFSVMIGVPPSRNKTGMLENTLPNLNMAWPESLGGGYHFMKFEGNYLDDKNITRGFTVHLGNEGLQVMNEFNNVNLSVKSENQTKIYLSMNLNEWFNHPHLFDFNVDGNYTMAVDSLMQKISENGKNCFTIKSIQ